MYDKYLGQASERGLYFFVVVADLLYYGFLFFVLAIGRALDVDALCCSVPLGTRYDADICRIPKGMLSLRRLPTSHFAVPMARLYGWLPLSDAYGIGCATGVRDVSVPLLNINFVDPLRMLLETASVS